MGDGPEYNATPVRCRVCEAIETASRAFAGIEEPNPSAGIRWRVERAQEVE
jgi:hypothetical protein